MKSQPSENVSAGPVSDELRYSEWSGTIFGPDASPYEGGIFEIRITFPDVYPWKPPRLYFLTPIYHPNVSLSTGFACISILKDGWTPALSVNSVLLSVLSMLSDANPQDPVEEKIAEQYINRRVEFDITAREYTEQFAQ